MNRHAPCLFPALFALALTGCASGSDYPSLARRDVERISGSAQAVAPEPAPPPPPSIPDAAISARLIQLVDQASAAHARFSAKRGRAAQLVAASAGAAAGSESWSVASVGLAELESARSDAMVALTEIDRIYAADREAHFNELTADAAAAAAARDRVQGLVDEEDRVLGDLGQRIGRR